MGSSSQDQSSSGSFAGNNFSRVAGPQGLQRGVNNAYARTNNALNDPSREGGITQGATSLANNTLAGNFLRPETNPGIQGVINNAANTIQNQTQSRFGQAGRNVGGPGAARQFADTLGQVAPGIIADNYARERGIQNNLMFQHSLFNPLDRAIGRLGPLAATQSDRTTQGSTSGVSQNLGTVTDNPSFLDMLSGGITTLFPGGQLIGTGKG